ncbi:unnamed protein product [Strongylus vulgaris]|uniref:Nematode cuticle collagen N-terminal domain-containing protein n=1 Tax=Strongylus vulgaris TaxID=40348 RepID=A0A3P7LPL6_STRVU|nr:unnamed protein product [Strongylus vulgaris]
MECESGHRLAAYRFVAYSAVAFSVVAVLSICITLPMVYNYIHHVKRSMNTEINFCKHMHNCFCDVRDAMPIPKFGCLIGLPSALSTLEQGVN